MSFLGQYIFVISSVSDSVPILLDVLFFYGPSVALGSSVGLTRGASLVRLLQKLDLLLSYMFLLEVGIKWQWASAGSLLVT